MDKAAETGVVNLITSMSLKDAYMSAKCYPMGIQQLTPDNHHVIYRSSTAMASNPCAAKGTLLRRYPALLAAIKVRATVRNILAMSPIRPGVFEAYRDRAWEHPPFYGE